MIFYPFFGRVQPPQFVCRFVGFGTRIAEKGHAAETAFGQHRRPLPLLFGKPGVRDVDQLADLFAHGLDDRPRAMPEQIAAPAGEEVEITLPVGVPNAGPFALDQNDRVPRVVLNDVFLKLCDGFLCGHGVCVVKKLKLTVN